MTFGASRKKTWARRTVVAALLAGGAFGGSTLAGTPAAMAAEAGVNINAITPETESRATALGVHWVRVFAPWSYLEPAEGQRAANWFDVYDKFLDSLPKGSHAILDVVGTPGWESHAAGNAPPRNPADYAALLHDLAARWKGKVAAYEIWNEEDASRWWAGAPDPAGYTRLLQASYPAVKSADPDAKVVLGGLTGNDYDFLQGVYAAGGKGYFDAVGVHTDTACNVASPYQFLRNEDGRLNVNSFLAYREVHATEVANGDDKPIWMTEASWRTTSATCSEGAWAGQKPEGISEEEQADFLAKSFHCMAEDPYVQVALWYPLTDEGEVTSGLERANLSHKPSYAAMRNYVEHGDQVGGPCGDFAGPSITLQNPSDGQRYKGKLKIKVVASDPQGIWRVRLFYDGHLIRNFVPSFYTHIFPETTVAEMQWSGARKLRVGKHQLTVVAIDKAHNTTSRQLSIVHLSERKHHRKHRHRHRPRRHH